MNKKIVSAVVGFALLASPLIVSAQSTDTTQSALIAQLTELVQTLTQQLAQLIAMRMQGAGTSPANPNGIGGTSPAPSAVPVQLDVTSQLSNNAAWTTVTIHGYQSNRNVSIWKLAITCDTHLVMIDPKSSVNYSDLCNTMRQYPTSQMADPTQDYEVLSNTVTNNGASYGTVTYVLTALSASGSVLGSNQQILTIPGNDTSYPVGTSTQSTGTTVTLAPVQGLGNTLAPQGAIVPMVKFSLSNTGSNDAQISSMQFRQVGSGSSAAIKSIEVTDDAGDDYIVPTYGDGSLFNASGFTSGIQNITLRAGQTKTFTASAWMQNNLSGLNSQLITLELGNYGSTAGVNLTGAALPIVGTTDTVSSTLNVCYPPQTSVYGYRCW